MCQAKLFRNAFISFELPPNWNCLLEGTEWVCENTLSRRTKEAIIVLTAKEVGPGDTLAAYKAHLQTPRLLPSVSGPSAKSKILHVKDVQLSGQPWVDGLHVGSEIGSYYTRYLATVKDRIAILVTLSAHKQHYTKYSNDFLKTIQSLRVVANKDLLADKPTTTIAKGNETIGAPIGQSLPLVESETLPLEDSTGGRSKWLNLFILAVLLGSAAGIIFLRARRKK